MRRVTLASSQLAARSAGSQTRPGFERVNTGNDDKFILSVGAEWLARAASAASVPSLPQGRPAHHAHT